MILPVVQTETGPLPAVKTTPEDLSMNLMESRKVPRGKSLPPQARWFTDARFGMFIHYGLYSVHGRGEWSMFNDRTAVEDYNPLADQFTAEKFDAEAVVDLAKRAGAGYVVLGARHHEGFCLWDTKTTAFNSVQTAAKRDLIREYVVACRRAGLRVGIYYSIMSWQFPAIHLGPYEDPEGWNAMVAETHEQVRELMTYYGQIDLLWYDGCMVPGSGEDAIRAKNWRTTELNAMVRQLQPAILINDRSASSEDISTPEQHLTPPPPGRLWECCQTLGNYWAWRPDDVFKNADELIRQLIFCARYGGNFLLNVALRGDGGVPEEQAERMEVIGRWLAINGEAIRGSERLPYTEAEHILGAATAHRNRLFFHITNWPETPARIAGVKSPILSAKLLATGQELKVQQSPDGTVTLLGLPAKPLDAHVTVVVLDLAKPVPRVRPPSLLVERETGRFAPEEAPVHQIGGWDWGTRQSLSFNVSVTGRYILELGLIGKQATRFSVVVDGNAMTGNFRLTCGDYPNTVQVSDLVLSKGRHTLELQSEGGIEFGLYLWRLQPVWQTVGAQHWRTVGPFPTEYKAQGTDEEVRRAMATSYSPEHEAFGDEVFHRGVGGKKMSWRKPSGRNEMVNFARIYGGKSVGVCYGRAIMNSPEKRSAEILVACDWWANVFVNGELVKSRRDPDSYARDGAWFSGWKPSPALITLTAGENEVMVKCHPGSTNNWFGFYINNPGDLKIRA